MTFTSLSTSYLRSGQHAARWHGLSRGSTQRYRDDTDKSDVSEHRENVFPSHIFSDLGERMEALVLLKNSLKASLRSKSACSSQTSAASTKTPKTPRRLGRALTKRITTPSIDIALSSLGEALAPGSPSPSSSFVQKSCSAVIFKWMII